MTAAAIVLAMALSACGGGSGSKGLKGEAAGTGGDEPGASADAGANGGGDNGASPTVPGGGGGKADAGTADKATGSNAGAPSTTVAEAPKPPMPFEVTLAGACVKAGGQQTITFKAPHKSAVVYDNRYPDGKSGLSEGFYGGNKGSLVPADGTWTDTWTIAPHAPAGQVTVLTQGVHLDYSSAEKELTFTLVGPTGTCP